MNPEFQRQLWLQFTPMRLVVLPLLLLIGFAAVGLSASVDVYSALALAGAAMFAMLVFGLGGYAAIASVQDEVSEHTWDQQRMSALSPWTMVWGKALGAASYGWYGGALAALVAFPCALLAGQAALAVHWLELGLLSGLSLHLLVIAVHLQLVKAGGRQSRRGNGFSLLVLLLLASQLTSLLGRTETLVWWGWSFDYLGFMLLTAALLLVCAAVGAWRTMADLLALRQIGWGWPALALVATVYASGFAEAGDYLPTMGLSGLSICLVLTYFALLAEPQTRPQWQRLMKSLREGRWRAAAQQWPRWTTSLVLALPFAGLCVSLSLVASDAWARLLNHAPLFALILVLLALRDCMLALFFYFAPQGRRPVLAFVTAMVSLYVLLPWLLKAAHSHVLKGFVLPLDAQGSVAIVWAIAHVVMAFLLLRWRWQTTGQQFRQ